MVKKNASHSETVAGVTVVLRLNFLPTFSFCGDKIGTLSALYGCETNGWHYYMITYKMKDSTLSHINTE